MKPNRVLRVDFGLTTQAPFKALLCPVFMNPVQPQKFYGKYQLPLSVSFGKSPSLSICLYLGHCEHESDVTVPHDNRAVDQNHRDTMTAWASCQDSPAQMYVARHRIPGKYSPLTSYRRRKDNAAVSDGAACLRFTPAPGVTATVLRACCVGQVAREEGKGNSV